MQVWKKRLTTVLVMLGSAIGAAMLLALAIMLLATGSSTR